MRLVEAIPNTNMLENVETKTPSNPFVCVPIGLSFQELSRITYRARVYGTQARLPTRHFRTFIELLRTTNTLTPVAELSRRLKVPIAEVKGTISDLHVKFDKLHDEKPMFRGNLEEGYGFYIPPNRPAM